MVQDAAPAGSYVGIDCGAGCLNSDVSASGATASKDFNGGLFGGFAGYIFQVDSIFLGVEDNGEYNLNDNDFGPAPAAN